MVVPAAGRYAAAPDAIVAAFIREYLVNRTAGLLREHTDEVIIRGREDRHGRRVLPGVSVQVCEHDAAIFLKYALMVAERERIATMAIVRAVLQTRGASADLIEEVFRRVKFERGTTTPGTTDVALAK